VSILLKISPTKNSSLAANACQQALRECDGDPSCLQDVLDDIDLPAGERPYR